MFRALQSSDHDAAGRLERIGSMTEWDNHARD
jgi:hypothetical protein